MSQGTEPGRQRIAGLARDIENPEKASSIEKQIVAGHPGQPMRKRQIISASWLRKRSLVVPAVRLVADFAREA